VNNENERVTAFLPKKYRQLAKNEWSFEGTPFNYSLVLREALALYFEGKGDEVSE